jgi:HEAT repeat protein
VDVLRTVLEAEPGKHEFFLKRLAARALGAIGGPRSAEALARNLAVTEGTLRLEEDCRAALVGIGPVAVPALSAALRTGGDAAVAAAAALRAIGDPTAHAALRAARDTAPGPTRRAIDEALAAGAGMWDKDAPDSGVNR